MSEVFSVTLTSPRLAAVGDAVRLSDAQVVTEGGDVALRMGYQLALVPPTGFENDSNFCDQGTHAALAEVPIDESFCAGDAAGRWQNKLFLSGASIHEDEASLVIGRGALVLDRARNTLYRLRVLGDSVRFHADGSMEIEGTVTFEYQRVR